MLVSVSTSGSKGVQLVQYFTNRFLRLVSVSTSGSKGVQPSSAASFDAKTASFSIHKRIEGGATGGQIKPFAFALVSVSTSGSKGVQRLCAAQTDGGYHVSVSTSGSKGVQQGDVMNNYHLLMSFSIHKRIEGGATEKGEKR